MTTRRRGFTLIELLIVISIIGLLIAIFVPQIPAIMKIVRVNISRSIMRQLVMGVEAYHRVYGAYFSDAIWWDGAKLTTGNRDPEYLTVQGYESLYLMLQGPDGTGHGPRMGSGVKEFGPVFESAGFIHQPASGERPYFVDPFGRPVLYYAARPASKYEDISVSAGHFILDTRYIYLVNFRQFEDMGTASPQRGADELPYGPGKMSRDVAVTHWEARLTRSKDAAGLRYPEEPKTYVIWMGGGDERFGYWVYSDQHGGYICDKFPDDQGVSDGVIGDCDDILSSGDR